MPDSEQRKLALQPFNGEEVYVSLGSGFHERHKKNSIVRDVSEFACGFVRANYFYLLLMNSITSFLTLGICTMVLK